MSEASRREALMDFVVAQYPSVQSGVRTHLDVLTSSIEFAFQGVRNDISDNPSDNYDISEAVIGDLKAVFVGNGLTDPTGRGQGPFWYGNQVGINEGRRGATGFSEKFHGRDDQVQHTIGGLVGAFEYIALAEWWAMFQENNEADYQINLETFRIGNALTDSNVNSLSSTLRASLTSSNPVLGGPTGDECFPASTPITLADGTSKPISDIRVGDEVLSFTASGALVAGTVTRLLENVTTEWVKLTRADDAEWELVATPGHRFLRPDGSFAAIADIAADDGRIVHAERMP